MFMGRHLRGTFLVWKVKVHQSCLTLCNPMDCSPWNSLGQNTGVGSFSLLQGIFPTRVWTQVSHIAGGFFTSWATREAELGPPESARLTGSCWRTSCSTSEKIHFSSLRFSHSVMSNSLQPHGLQHARPPYPSPTPRVCSNSCPLCRWCHPAISSSVVAFSFCLQSFPASGSFQMSQLFISGGQSNGVSASGSVLPMNIQDWFPLG